MSTTHGVTPGQPRVGPVSADPVEEVTEMPQAPIWSGRPVLGVVTHPTKDVTASLSLLTRAAAEHGAALVARAKDHPDLADAAARGLSLVGDAAFQDMVTAVVALGGDGTMLGALRSVAARPVPVLGVNHGNLGFLIELAPSDLDSAIARLLAGDFTLQALAGLRLACSRGASCDLDVAFNDLVLARRGSRSSVAADLMVNDERYGYYRCDALIVATATGSTAYNYAAGGPVVSPSSAATVITPVAPMSGISRSVVLGADDVVELTIGDEDHPAGLVVDGVEAGFCPAGTSVSLRALPEPGQVIRLDHAEHGRRSLLRLSLLDLPLRGDQLAELAPEHLQPRDWTGPGR